VFEIFPGDPNSRIVIHVPHASSFIPESVRSQFLLTSVALRAEAELMADTDTDKLALAAYERSVNKPWLFINRTSRLVVDPERFPDASETMNKVGMGVVYEKTSDQKPLRLPDEAKRLQLVAEYFDPYSRAFEALVHKTFALNGAVTIVDLHSYSPIALPYELNQQGPRPNVCLGLDDFHTSPELAALAKVCFKGLGTVGVNSPFAGTYVPLRFYGSEPKVQSIMLEIRKDTYAHCVEGSSAFNSTAEAITQLVAEINKVRK